jgi:D-inositol-3-phosphate glycosyltransferase
MRHKIKVCMIEPIGGHGGNELYDFGLCEAISKQGIEVTLYTCDETTLDEKFCFNTKVKKYYKAIYRNDNKLLRGIRYVKGTLKSLLDAKSSGNKISHFHIYGFSYLEYLNLFLFKKAGFKIVATIHDVEKLSDLFVSRSQEVYKKFFNLIDAFIVHTKFTMNELKRYVPEIEKKKIYIVPSADRDFLFNKDIEKKKARKELDLQLPDDALLILFFGQIKQVKGLDVLIRAFSEINKSIPNSYLLIVGKEWKTSFTEYEKLIKELKIDQTKIIKNIKYIENKKVPLYFKASDIVVLPYKKVYNSGVVVRAMDYATPIIASDLEPFKEVIEHGHNGLLFKNGDYKDLVKKIEILASDINLREKLKDNARNLINKKYSWEVIGRKMKEIYLNLLDE